jgi:hypothetical protein
MTIGTYLLLSCFGFYSFGISGWSIIDLSSSSVQCRSYFFVLLAGIQLCRCWCYAVVSYTVLGISVEFTLPTVGGDYDPAIYVLTAVLHGNPFFVVSSL